jgi:hypothetical protein
MKGAVRGSRAAGTSFSHQCPKRLIKQSPALKKLFPRDGHVWYNGKVVPNKYHSLTDPYFFLKGDSRAGMLIKNALLLYILRAQNWQQFVAGRAGQVVLRYGTDR